MSTDTPQEKGWEGRFDEQFTPASKAHEYERYRYVLEEIKSFISDLLSQARKEEKSRMLIAIKQHIPDLPSDIYWKLEREPSHDN